MRMIDALTTVPASMMSATIEIMDRSRPVTGSANSARNVYTSGAQYSDFAYYGYGAAAACVIG